MRWSRYSAAAIQSNMAESTLTPGDHIYCDRRSAAKLYSHHGIYIGHNAVIHFAVDSSPAGYPRNKRDLLHPDPVKELEDTRFIRIMYGSLNDFSGGDTVLVVEYNENMSILERDRREIGSCHRVKAMPLEETLKVAKFFARKWQLWDTYNLYSNNCETFACFCKTGLLNIACQLHPEAEVVELFETPCSTAHEAIRKYLRDRNKKVSSSFLRAIDRLPLPLPRIPLVPGLPDPHPDKPSLPLPDILSDGVKVLTDPVGAVTEVGFVLAEDGAKVLTDPVGAVTEVVTDPEKRGKAATAAIATVALGPVGFVLAKAFNWNLF